MTDENNNSSAATEESSSTTAKKKSAKKKAAPKAKKEKKAKTPPAPRLKKVATFRLAAGVEVDKIRSKSAQKLARAMSEKLDGPATAEEIAKAAGTFTDQDNKVAVATTLLKRYSATDAEEKLFVQAADREVEVSRKPRAKKAAA